MASAALDLVLQESMIELCGFGIMLRLKILSHLDFCRVMCLISCYRFAMPLADHVGGVDGLESLMDEGKWSRLNTWGFIRGRDIKHTIIM